LDHFISLVPEDGAAVAAHVPQLRAVVPVVARNTTVRLGPRTTRVRLIGTTPDYQHVRRFPLHHGRFLAATDEADRVIVLGHAVSHELAPRGARPGQDVFLGTVPYQVVGVLRPQGINFAGDDEDHQVFIPLETYQRRIGNRPWVHHLYLQLAPEADSGQTMRRVQSLLRERHGRGREQVDDAVIRDVADLTARQSDLLRWLTWAAYATSGLLLVMGVVGIGTLMVLVVRQRRTEIGLRRAVGATAADVGFQFFLEGIVLAAVGVLAGLCLGLGGSLTVAWALGETIALDVTLPLFAGSISLAASALACLFPALLAARLEPAAALRS
jgi:putative ABC transport system permease protein